MNYMTMDLNYMTSNKYEFSPIELNDGDLMKIGNNVAKNVKAIRLREGLSQQDLANKTGLTVRYISRLENTAPNITLEVLEKLADGLSCSSVELIETGKSDFYSKKHIELLDQTIKFLQSLRSRM